MIFGVGVKGCNSEESSDSSSILSTTSSYSYTASSSSKKSSSSSSSSNNHNYTRVTDGKLTYIYYDGSTCGVKAASKNISGDVVIPSTYGNRTVTAIEYDVYSESNETKAFVECEYIETLYVPSTIRTIDTGGFLLCSSLYSFVVSDENEYYKAKNDVLYTKAELTLVAYPASKSGSSYTISSSTKTLAFDCFANSQFLTSLTIPTSVTAIEGYAFILSSIRNVAYLGTKSQWNNINLDSNWHASAEFTSITCSDGIVYL